MAESIAHNPGSWYIVNAVNGADKLVMRLRVDKPSDDKITTFSTSVVIKWEYPRLQGMSMPSKEEFLRMAVFDDAIADLMWDAGHSYLMNISTGLGVREWCFYTNGRDRFMQRLNKLLVGHERYPLKVEFYDDPEWKVWLDLRHAYERTGGEPVVQANQPLQRTGAAGILSKIKKWLGRGPGR